MMLFLRALTRALGTLWMLLLALAGLGLALFCFDGLISLGAIRPDRLLHLPVVRRHVGHFLNQLAYPGTTAGLALLGGLIVMALGAVVLFGLLWPRRHRLVVIERDGSGGTRAARPRAVRDMARALAEQADGATSVKRPRVSPFRKRAGGRLRVRATRASTGDANQVEQAVRERLEPLSKPFHLTARVRIALGERGSRVQ